jgi:hypothetical protein
VTGLKLSTHLGQPVSYPGWHLSGFRDVAHWIYADGEYLKAACGVFWWTSDDVSSIPAKPGTSLCERCLRTNRVKEAS